MLFANPLKEKMGKYDFDIGIDRRRLGVLKFRSVPEDVIPMSVADTEFAAMPEIVEALQECAAAASFGYSTMNEFDYDAVISWVKHRHGENIPREHLLATPGVLYTMRCAMYTLSKTGDQIVVQPPLHTPSIATAGMQGRIPVKNNLYRLSDGTYTFDYEALEQYFRKGARLMMFCAPNNPTGRVWTLKELSELVRLICRYDVQVVSDEIHRDIVYRGKRHISIGSLPGMAERTITVFSPSKTFNMGELHIGSAVVANSEIREKLKKTFYEFGHTCSRPDIFARIAQTAAYRYGGKWLDELLEYLEGNISLALEYLEGTPLLASHPDSTYLLWVDCSELKMNTEELMRFMVEKAHILPDPGHFYDNCEIDGYNGLQHHIRLNIAMPRTILKRAMEGLRKALL
jgi:cystathionine beta-lyase